MVEGYTDNVPIKNNCIDDNWDLSVKRSATVVRSLQTKHGIDPNKLLLLVEVSIMHYQITQLLMVDLKIEELV
jgi:hypothetical protein